MPRIGFGRILRLPGRRRIFKGVRWMAWNGLNVARQMTLPLIVPVESRIAIVAGKDHVLFLDMGSVDDAEVVVQSLGGRFPSLLSARRSSCKGGASGCVGRRFPQPARGPETVMGSGSYLTSSKTLPASLMACGWVLWHPFAEWRNYNSGSMTCKDRVALPFGAAPSSKLDAAAAVADWLDVVALSFGATPSSKHRGRIRPDAEDRHVALPFGQRPHLSSGRTQSLT